MQAALRPPDCRRALSARLVKNATGAVCSILIHCIKLPDRRWRGGLFVVPLTALPLPANNLPSTPFWGLTFYSQAYIISFRVVRFKLSDSSFETVLTNLDFPPDELKQLYAMRWGIETSFRELKYTIGLSHFHAKRPDFILQEIFARLTMYNFSELISMSVVIERSGNKYAYRANFSAAAHICRNFFLGRVAPTDLEALIPRFVSPVRPGRASPRHPTVKYPVSFLYRLP